MKTKCIKLFCLIVIAIYPLLLSAQEKPTAVVFSTISGTKIDDGDRNNQTEFVSVLKNKILNHIFEIPILNQTERREWLNYLNNGGEVPDNSVCMLINCKIIKNIHPNNVVVYDYTITYLKIKNQRQIPIGELAPTKIQKGNLNNNQYANHGKTETEQGKLDKYFTVTTGEINTLRKAIKAELQDADCKKKSF